MTSEPGRPPDGGSADARLSVLREKLDAERRKDQERTVTRDYNKSGMAQALKLGSEFVAGVIVGFVIGFSIDRFLGTTPWGMIVFLLLGFAAGTLNVMRATGVVAERLPQKPVERKGDES